MEAGISTLGIKLYAAESVDGARVTDAASYSRLTRINSIGEVVVEPENIDASALEDYTTKNIAGRGGVTDSLAITVNATDETIGQWEGIRGKRMCFMTTVPGLSKAYYVIAQVPTKIPQPAFDQNGLLTFVMNCTVNDFIGLEEAVEVTDTTE